MIADKARQGINRMPLKRAGENVRGEWLSVVSRPSELNCLRIKEHPACEAVQGFRVSANVLRPAWTGMSL